MFNLFESPLVQRMLAKRLQDLILVVLKARFDAVPRDVRECLREVIDEKKLRALNRVAATCPDIEAFREALPKMARDQFGVHHRSSPRSTVYGSKCRQSS